MTSPAARSAVSRPTIGAPTTAVPMPAAKALRHTAQRAKVAGEFLRCSCHVDAKDKGHCAHRPMPAPIPPDITTRMVRSFDTSKERGEGCCRRRTETARSGWNVSFSGKRQREHQDRLKRDLGGGSNDDGPLAARQPTGERGRVRLLACTRPVQARKDGCRTTPTTMMIRAGKEPTMSKTAHPAGRGRGGCGRGH